jgi:SAM-dependent methyltransferase
MQTHAIVTDMFKDHFSGHAADYARFRPLYPPAVYRWLADQAPDTACAWDVATGNGQAAVGLAAHFDAVLATDASGEQIREARLHAKVRYEVARCDHCAMDDRSVDLVLVAQALHWFDLPAFYAEVQRVCRPRALVAALSYGLFNVAPDIDAIIRRLYSGTLRPDWPPERALVDNGYRDLPFPFAEIRPPYFEMRERWSLEQLLGYLRTWSAVVRHAERTGSDPVAAIQPRLAAVWGDVASSRVIRWPLAIRAGLTAG